MNGYGPAWLLPQSVATTVGWVTDVSATSTTGFDITSASDSSGYTLYKGNPSQWGNLQPGGYVDFMINAASGGSYDLQLYYSTTLTGGAAILIDGVQQQTASFPTTGSWSAFAMSSSVTLTIPAGASTLRIAAQAAFEPFNLAGMSIAPATVSTYPLANQTFYVNPYSEAAINVNQSCSAYYPATPNLVSKIAAQPQGVWFGDWNVNVRSDASVVMDSAALKNAVPIMVSYNIPIRDCAGYSGGGATSAAAYQTWIQNFAAGIGSGKAMVVLEPDALLQLTQAGCLNAAEQTERLQLLTYAVQTLKQTAPNASVYIDAGRAGLYAVPPAQMAQRLISAGIAAAAGFSLNVSNYIDTARTTTYGQQISALAGNKHFIIDTSRNGLGAAGDLNWCNPLNRGLGLPSQGFSSGTVDGYIWVQNPGTSDGPCNGGPPAGQFSLPIACTLAHNAIF